MPEEHHSHDNGATPASNQNLILGLVLGAAVLLLGFLVIQNLNNGNNQQATNPELVEIKAQVRDEKERINRLHHQNSLGPIGNNISGINPEALANEISSEADQLAGLVSQISSVIAQKDQALQTAEGTRQALSKRISDLERQLADLSSSATESLSLRQKLEANERLLSAANTTIEDLRHRLHDAPDSAQLEALHTEADRLRNELASLSGLEAELRRLREENQALRAKIDSATLFVEADALPAQAQKLYRELDRLEGLDAESLAAQYARIGSQLNARVLRKITFKTGSSALTAEKIAMLENDVSASPGDSFLLVVGYASTTGDTDNNRKLSSDRATAVASQINAAKKTRQNVRAVFLSETTRFSPTDPKKNQICEVWEIMKE